jgi:hypothetical protein
MFGNELSCYRLEKELMLHEMKRIKRQVKPEKGRRKSSSICSRSLLV